MSDRSAILSIIEGLVSDSLRIAAELEELKAKLIADPTVDGAACDQIILEATASAIPDEVE